MLLDYSISMAIEKNGNPFDDEVTISDITWNIY